MNRVLVAAAVVAGSLAVPVALTAAGPAGAATACTPSTTPAAVTLDATTLDLGARIAFHGTGWCHPADGGSRIGVKLDAGEVNRLDTTVSGNTSVWAIVDADPATGDFAGSFTLPDGTTRTSSPALGNGAHSLTFLTGSLKSGDTVRSQTVAFAIGSGAPGGGASTGPKPTCTPTTPTAQVHLGSTTAALGGTLHVTGTGFCNPAGGGSLIGVKLDDGAYVNRDGSSVWAKIQAADADGTFSVDLTLPDGTTATSTPAFSRGGHTLRLLTGSLAAGDTVRTLQSATFSIGAYAPSGLPDPLAAPALRPATRHGAKAVLGRATVVVRLPRTPAGTWVLPVLYDAQGSPSYPWSDWHRLPASHRLVLARTPIASTGATGVQRLAVQSGDEGRVGVLLGWARLRLPAASTSTAPRDPAAPPPAPSAPTAPPALTPSAAPATTDIPTAPQPPFAAYADLDPRRHGSVAGRVDAGILTLTARSAAPGDLVAVHVYTPDAVLSAGWATLAADRSVTIDLTGLSGLSGYAGATVQAADGRLLGWAPLVLTAADAADTMDTAVDDPATDPETNALRPVATTGRADPWLSGADGLLLALGALVLAGTSLVTSLVIAPVTSPATPRRTRGGTA